MTERLPPPDTSRFPALSTKYVRTLAVGTLVGRVFFTSGEYPSAWNQFRSFGPTANRFDHHLPPSRVHRDRAILYGAPVVRDVDGTVVPPLATCLLEVFRDSGVVDVKSNTPYFALFRVTRPLRLVDLVDSDWVTVAGGNAAISSGRRQSSREWARAIYAHYADDAVDGLYYGSSNLPRGRSLALFERARDSLPSNPELHLPLSEPGLANDLDILCEEVGLVLVHPEPSP